jgi:hypothetical protein
VPFYQTEFQGSDKQKIQAQPDEANLIDYERADKVDCEREQV